MLSDAVSADITVHRGQEREREHLAWEEVMEIHDVKNKKGGGRKKMIAESAVRLKSICHHILLTHCNRCSLKAMPSATNSKANKSLNHHSLTVR